jgi:uncharacterized protein
MTDGEPDISHTDLCLYLDFYGQLLTSHCRDVLEMHYGDDMSLGEIAESLSVTRQAVHDRIRQGVRQLAAFEHDLSLIARFKSNRAAIVQAIQALDAGETGQARVILEKLAAEI